MTISSVGFAGTIDEVNEEVWSSISTYGAEYGVATEAACKVSIVSGVDRTVRVAVGSCWGKGVLAVSDATVDIQLSPIASGQRWDTIVARRDRGSADTTFIALSGTSTKSISASRTSGWGAGTDDQPLALARVVAGQSNVVEVVDLRCWAGNGGVVAASAEALGYLTAPGSVVWVDGACWVRQVAANGTSSWVKVLPNVDVVGAPLLGVYSGQVVKRKVTAKTWSTDGNGDVIVMPLAEFNGVMTADLKASSIYPLVIVCRPDQGNVVARVWENGVRRTNTSFAAVADVHYW